MRENPFSFCHGGSSDTSIKKMNPVCVTIFDINNSKHVESKFCDMCDPQGRTVERLKYYFRPLIIILFVTLLTGRMS